MKSDEISVSSREDRTGEVLAQADRVAAFGELSPKNALRLRLLAEEMMGLMRAIADDVEGVFWIENDGPRYELHMRVQTVMDYQKREQLLSTATSGKNEAERGLIGKLCCFFENVDTMPMFFTVPVDGIYSDAVWSMCSYQQYLQQSMLQNQAGAKEAWDELEKSVVAHLADDVKISILGYDVEMTVLKDFS